MQYEYVISGCAHTRMTLLSAFEEPTLSKIKSIFKSMQGRNEHKFTALFNAYTEKNIGIRFHDSNIVGEPLHADSGGLQIISRGMKMTEEIKEKIYHVQGRNAGVAMSFDEIPVTRVAGNVQQKDPKARMFHPAMLEGCAIATAKNVTKQIEIFRKYNYASKPLLVVQGYGVDDYLKWVDTCVKHIPKEMHDDVAGMSFASTTSGLGDLEDIERNWAFVRSEAPDNWKQQYHLLGVGAVNRMGPTAAFCNNGLIDCLVSYDSTTHSSNITNRRFTNDAGNLVSYQQFNIVAFTQHYYDIINKFPGYIEDMSLEYVHNCLSMNKEGFLAYGGNLTDFHVCVILSVLASINNMTKVIQNISTSKKEYIKWFGQTKPHYCNLLDVKSQDDYHAYMRDIGAFISTKKVSTENSTLDEFF